MASSASYQNPEKPPSYDETSKMPGNAPTYQTQVPTQVPTQVQTVYAAHPGYIAAPVTMITTPTVLLQPMAVPVGNYPQAMQCPACRQQIVSVVRYSSGTFTWLIAGIIFIFGGVLGCCLIPFCINSCKDAVHTCPACGNFIGRRNAM